MNEDVKKTVGRAFAAAIDRGLHCRIYVGDDGIRCQALNNEFDTANLPLSWQELQTVLGDYATVTPKPKPRPAQAEVAVTGTERSAALLRRRAGSKGGIE